MTLFTIGYEGLTLEQFLGLLQRHAIEQLVDIREAPVSRKLGFAKDDLAKALETAGIRYSHARALGCPKPIRDRYKQTGDWARYTRDFTIYLAAQNDALAKLRLLASGAPTCLLCYEADFNRCHRAMVAEAVARAGEQIRHIPVKPPSPQGELAFE